MIFLLIKGRLTPLQSLNEQSAKKALWKPRKWMLCKSLQQFFGPLHRSLPWSCLNSFICTFRQTYPRVSSCVKLRFNSIIFEVIYQQTKFINLVWKPCLLLNKKLWPHVIKPEIRIISIRSTLTPWLLYKTLDSKKYIRSKLSLSILSIFSYLYGCQNNNCNQLRHVIMKTLVYITWWCIKHALIWWKLATLRYIIVIQCCVAIKKVLRFYLFTVW